MVVKECPVCGENKVKIRKTLTDSVYIFCSNCGTGVGHFPTEEKAINGWNNLNGILEMMDLDKCEVKKCQN